MQRVYFYILLYISLFLKPLFCKHLPDWVFFYSVLWFYLFSFLLWTIGYLTSPYTFPSPFCCLCCLFIALFGWFGFAWFITLITSSCSGDREGAMEGGKLLLPYCCLLCDLTGWERNTKVGGTEMGGTGAARIPLPFNNSARLSRNDRFFHPFLKPFRGRGWSCVSAALESGQKEKIPTVLMWQLRSPQVSPQVEMQSSCALAECATLGWEQGLGGCSAFWSV